MYVPASTVKSCPVMLRAASSAMKALCMVVTAEARTRAMTPAAIVRLWQLLGQAVQNFNLMFGLAEATGLAQVALFP